LNIRQMVTIIESSIVEMLAQYGINASANPSAPGVYIYEQKIASLGLRLKHQCCYHGLSLNVDMDLTPFKAIDPCGYVGLSMTQTKDLGVALTVTQVGDQLINVLKEKLETWPKAPR
jgi:lipoyl(octanoyl) transferase